MTYPLLRKSSLKLLFPALAPALGGAVSLQGGLLLGLVILGLVLVTGALNIVLAGAVPLPPGRDTDTAGTAGEELHIPLTGLVPRGVRMVCTAITAITGATLVRFFLLVHDPELLEAVGVFLPLVTINILVLRQAVLYEPEGAAARLGLRRLQFGRSLWLGFVFLLVLGGTGAVREVLLTGSLGDTAILAIDLSFFGAPGGVLLVIGALLAAAKALTLGSRGKEA